VQEEADYVKHLEGEVLRLTEQVETILSDMERMERNLEELSSSRDNLQQSSDLLSSSWKFTISQLEATQQEVKALTARNEELLKALEEKSAMGDALSGQLEAQREIVASARAERDELRAICADALSDVEQDWFKLNQDIRSHRRELQKIQSHLLEERFEDVEGESLQKDQDKHQDSSPVGINGIDGNTRAEGLFPRYQKALEDLEHAKAIIERKGDALLYVVNKIDASLAFKCETPLLSTPLSLPRSSSAPLSPTPSPTLSRTPSPLRR
jgi:chromosome segregation ATPase